MKQCNKCKEWKNEDEFGKRKDKKDGLQNKCKCCDKKYRENNKEKIKQRQKEYYKNNKEKIKYRVKEWQEENKEWRDQYKKEWEENNKGHKKQLMKEYRENNKEWLDQKNKEWRDNNKEWLKEKGRKNYIRYKEWYKQYYLFPLEYNSFSQLRKDIELYEEIRKSENGNVEIRCANCENWFEPTKRQIKKRINAINGEGNARGECKLYCSQECKDNCPIFHQKIYPKGHKPYLDREVQPELSKMVLERDEYTCIICQRHQNEVELHCHHIEGIRWNPIESADMDTCTTLCKDCHKEVHKQEGCTYNEMKCFY